jgi:hypothetical protein
MFSLAFFADADDAGLLVKHLNEDPDLAFLVPLDPIRFLPRPGIKVIEQRRWQAVRTVESLSDGWHALWHTAAPDPLRSPPGEVIADPWKGWREDTIVSSDRVLPNVSPGQHQGLVYLDLQARHRPYSDDERAAGGRLVSYWMEPHEVLVVSLFQWIGGRYRPAPKETIRWWNGLRRWLGRACTKLTDPSGRQTFYAFPSALARLQSGIKYRALNWDLGASIQRARRP